MEFRGAGKKGLVTHIKSLVMQHDLGILPIIDPCTGERKVDIFNRKVSFLKSHFEHVMDFPGGI